MKALVLAAGYAVRLRPLTLNTPKPLLPVGGRPMIDYVVETIGQVDEVDSILVVVNHRFLEHFEAWLKEAPTSKPIRLIDDGSISEEDRLGAIGDMNLVVQRENIAGDLLVVGGDNLFTFSLRDFVSFYREKGTSVVLHSCGDIASAKRFSNVEVDATGRIVSFREKPENPTSDLVAICVYLFEPAALRLLTTYLEEGENPDAPGHFIEWLCQRMAVYGKPMAGQWFDIGDQEAYREADGFFTGGGP
jgi:glucose-1-phosphate thymidylyltransferase